jgi:hypothetical protein
MSEEETFTAAEYVQGLREMADWIAANEEWVDKECGYWLNETLTLRSYALTSEEFAEHVKTLGRGEKHGDETYFNVTRRFGPCAIAVYTNREKVCRKTTRIETQQVEVTDWVCEEPIFSHLDDVPEVGS